ncbi:Auxilin-related protein 2 [Glycine max]|nr:Auxilin-related protein 2 [Glycine max]
MNDFDGLLATDFGFKPQGKSAPMAASKVSSNNKTSSLNFDLGSRSTRTSNSSVNAAAAAASFDDLFGDSSVFRASADFRSKSVNVPVHDGPVFDKPVYDDDDDIFDGVPGLKSSSKVSYDDVFAPGGSAAAAAAFDDLLGRLGKSEKVEKGAADFDDLIPGFRSSKASTDGIAVSHKTFMLLENAAAIVVASEDKSLSGIYEILDFRCSIENAVAWVVILKCVSQREASSQISLLASFPNCNLSSLRVTSPSTLAAPAPATFLSLVWGKITGSGPFDPVSKSLKLVFHCSHDLVCSWCDVEVVPLPLICDIVATSRLPKQRFFFLRTCLCSYFEVRLTIPDINLSPEPTIDASKTASSTTDDPFKVFESTSAPVDSSSDYFTDPLEEISKFTSSRSTKNDRSSNSNGEVYDDIDPFGGLGNSVPAFSAERNSMKGSSSPTPRSNTSSSWTRDKESNDISSVRSPDRKTPNKILVDHDQEFHQAAFDMPTYSSDSYKPVGQRSTFPSYDNNGFKQANTLEDMSPKYEEKLESNDDIWLMVSEIPLFTQPTAAPPPSRPPPPRPVHILKSGAGSSASANVRKKDNDFSYFPSSTQFSQGPKSAPAAAKFSSASQFDELEDFAMGKSRDNDDEGVNGLADKELEMNSAAAAMKEAMDRAEAKFRHAKGVRERENTKVAKSKEPVQLDKDGKVVSEDRGKQERLDHEWQQKEREEKEQRRCEKEREEKEREQQRLERERERARQAVERATREARERAAAEARQRAERAAVEKANAEARKRAERTAVQRAQAEARERAAAEAKERAEKAAAEAKEREVRERAAAARAEPEARVKAERAAVERAAAEARERAVAQARERAAAAARMSQQQNDNDLESFFSTDARANSAPRPPRPSSSDSVFDAQFQSDVTRKSTGVSSSMKKASSSTNIVDDLSSIFGAAPSSSGEFQEIEGETEERRRARLERHQRTQERAAKALAEKNQRDLQTQRDQAERHRVAETLDFEIKRWAAGKVGNLRALLSTLQYVLWPECGWQPVSLTDLITAAAVRKVYRKATLCTHPDKVQQKGATIQQKYIAEKVFDLLKCSILFVHFTTGVYCRFAAFLKHGISSIQRSFSNLKDEFNYLKSVLLSAASSTAYLFLLHQ